MARVTLHTQRGERGFLDASPPLWLSPGEREVDDGLLSRHRETAAFRAAVESGEVSVSDAVSLGEPGSADADPGLTEDEPVEERVEPASARSSLDGLNSRDACKVVSGTDDQETLRRWAETESRSSVLRSIRRKLK